MSKPRTTSFHKGDLVVVTHTIRGLYENMLVSISNPNKDKNEEVKVSVYGRVIPFPKKYLVFPKPNRYSSKFNVGDDAIVTRHYDRFIPDAHVNVLSNYLGTTQKIIVQDERNITGPIPEAFLKGA